MVSKTTTTASILLLFAALISGWLLVLSNPIHESPNRPENPNSFGINVYSTEFDQWGKIKTIWISPKMINYTQENITTFEDPRLTVYKPNQPPWLIKADHGKSFHGKDKVFVWGNVVAHQPPGKNSHNTTLLSPTMTIYPNQSYAITQDPVTIQKPQNIVHAVGMKIDLKTNKVTLLSQTKGNVTQEKH